MNKKPTQLKVLEGCRGHKRLPADEPRPRPVRPTIPAAIDAAAKRHWKKIAPVLERIGLLTEADGAALAAICQSQAILENLYRELDRTNRTLKKAESGGRFKNEPVTNTENNNENQDGAAEMVTTLEKRRADLWKEIRLQQANFRLQASEFGLTPRGRVGLVVGGRDTDDDEALLTKAP